MLEQIDTVKTTADAANEHRSRLLPFSGAKNFRDLGGYQTTDGRTVRWGLLYRSDMLSRLTKADHKFLLSLSIDRIIDFRTDWEKQENPDRLPDGMDARLVEIPILDSSTKVWRDAREEMASNLKNLDPIESMILTNTELGSLFTPEFRKFMQEVLSASGRPVLFHCTAGKDRTGFASAIILRMLGVPQETIMNDYLLTNEYLVPGYKWSLLLMRLLKGKRFLQKIRGFMLAHPSYLSAAFDVIDREHGSFENYVRNGLGVSERDIERLKELYLE